MNQLSYIINNTSELKIPLARAKKAFQDMPQEDNLLITVVMPTTIPLEEALILRSRLSLAFPNAKILGHTSAMKMTDLKLNESGIMVSFTFFDSSVVDFVVMPAKHSREMLKERFVTAVEERPDTKAIELLVSGIVWDIEDMLADMSDIDESIEVFGGLVDYLPTEMRGYVFTNDEIVTNGMVAVLFRGEHLEVKICNTFGWTPLGKEMEVTEVVGNVLKSLDNISPIKLYEKYFGIMLDPEFPWNVGLFPLVFEEEDGTMTARVATSIIDAEAQGNLVYAVPPKEGIKVRFAYGNPYQIMKIAADNHAILTEFAPQAIISIGCIAHYFLLNDDVVSEMAIQGEIPSACSFSYGEIRRVGKRICSANMTVMTVGMKENNVATPFMVLDEPKTVSHFSHQRKVLAFMAHFVSISDEELNLTNKKLRNTASRDALTNLLNRRAMETILQHSMELARLHDTPLSVAMMDIDNFKTVNDELGHDVGDRALKLVADVIARNVRSSDYACRWGGDEFFIVLQHTPLEIATKVAERIHASIYEQSKTFDIELTVSIGVTEFKPYQDTYMKLFKVADDALYEAKERGRNNVAVIE